VDGQSGSSDLPPQPGVVSLPLREYGGRDWSDAQHPQDHQRQSAAGLLVVLDNGGGVHGTQAQVTWHLHQHQGHGLQEVQQNVEEQVTQTTGILNETST